MKRAGDRMRSRRGAVAVEAAVVGGALLYVLLGVFEYGRIVMTRQLMDNAVRAGARIAVVSTNTSPATTLTQIQNAVNSYLAGQQLLNVQIQVYQINPATGANVGVWSAAPFGATIAVKLSAAYVPIMPPTFGILPSQLQLHAIAIMGSEAN